MDIRVCIQKNQIHNFTDGVKEILQFDMRLPDYPDLPTYGLRVEYPIDKTIILNAIRAELQKVKNQIAKDDTIRTSFDSWNLLNITVTNV